MRSRMTDRITRRDVLKFGTTAAASVALRPLIERSMETRAMEPDHQLASITENMDTPAASDSDICFLSARRMADLIRQKRLSAREVMRAHLRQIKSAIRLADRKQMSDRKSTRLNSSHSQTSHAVFCLKKKTITAAQEPACTKSARPVQDAAAAMKKARGGVNPATVSYLSPQ